MRKILLALALLLTPGAAFAQSSALQGAPGPFYFGTDPTVREPCRVPSIFFDTDATSGQRIMACEGGVYVLQAGGGGGGGAPTGSQYVTLATDATLSAERVFTPGLAMDTTDGGANGNITFDFDPTELTGARTWSDGSGATAVWTWNLSGTDPSITFGSGVVNISAGTLQQAGTNVALQSLTLTGGTGIAALGDLSANRTVSVDLTELTLSGGLVASSATALDFGSLVTTTRTVTIGNSASDLTLLFDNAGAGAVTIRGKSSSTNGDSLQWFEATGNGTNKITALAPNSLTADRSFTWEDDATPIPVTGMFATANEAGLESGFGGIDIALVAGNIGAATATTPATNDSDTSVATTAYVQGELVADIVAKTTNYTVVENDCKNGALTNNGATGAIAFTLPADPSTGLTCAFFLQTAQDVDIDPAGTTGCTIGAACDRIIRDTDANGDKLSSDAAVGSLIVVTSLDNNTWIVSGIRGTWTDAN